MVQLCCAVVVTQVVKLFSPITRTSSMVLFLISYISHNFLFRHQEAVAAKTEYFTGKWIMNPHLLSAIKRTRQEYAQSC